MTDSPGPELRHKFVSFLEERGLTLEDARKLKLKLYTRERARRELPDLPSHFAGFRIPYFDFTGRVNGVYRFRYLGDHWDRRVNSQKVAICLSKKEQTRAVPTAFYRLDRMRERSNQTHHHNRRRDQGGRSDQGRAADDWTRRSLEF
jgi:hypothetical protein